MDQALTNISPAALAGLIVAYLLAASRIAGPLTNAWASLRKPWAVIIPAIVAMLPQVADAFTDVNSWQSFAVSVTTAIALILPGIKPKPPEPPSGNTGRDGTVIPPGPLTPDEDPPSLPGAFKLGSFIAVGFMVACSGAPKNPQHPDPACSDENFGKLAAACAAEAATCVAKGGTEELCGQVCDAKADAWQEKCQ